MGFQLLSRDFRPFSGPRNEVMKPLTDVVVRRAGRNFDSEGTQLNSSSCGLARVEMT